MMQYAGQTPTRRWLTVLESDAPAAGADPSVTVQGGDLLQVVSVFAELTTDATVAARLSRLLVGNGGGTIASYPGISQAASLTSRQTWATGAGARLVDQDYLAAIAPMVLQPGWTLALETDNLQAADQWSRLRVLAVVTQFRGGPEDLPLGMG